MENSVDFLSAEFECNGDDVVFVRFSIFAQPDESEPPVFCHRLLVVIALDFAVVAVAADAASIVLSTTNGSCDGAGIFAFARR